jgi:hypothetical protein
MAVCCIVLICLILRAIHPCLIKHFLIVPFVVHVLPAPPKYGIDWLVVPFLCLGFLRIAPRFFASERDPADLDL